MTTAVSAAESISAVRRVAFLQRKSRFQLQLSALVGHFASAESSGDDTRRVEGLSRGTLLDLRDEKYILGRAKLTFHRRPISRNEDKNALYLRYSRPFLSMRKYKRVS